MKILVIDANYLFGNGFLFPAGPLRQTSSSALRNADVILLIGSEQLPKSLVKYRKKVFSANYKASGSYNSKKSYLAFSALANNAKFFNSLSDHGLRVEEYIEFSDHYSYRVTDIVNLIQLAAQKGLTLITTSKDYVKLPKRYQKEIVEFKIELVINSQAEFIKILKRYVKKS